jgi:hypothetical protein
MIDIVSSSTAVLAALDTLQDAGQDYGVWLLDEDIVFKAINNAVFARSDTLILLTP